MGLVVCEGCLGRDCACETLDVCKIYKSCTTFPKHECREVTELSCGDPGGLRCIKGIRKDAPKTKSREKVKDREIPCPRCGMRE